MKIHPKIHAPLALCISKSSLFLFISSRKDFPSFVNAGQPPSRLADTVIRVIVVVVVGTSESVVVESWKVESWKLEVGSGISSQ